MISGIDTDLDLMCATTQWGGAVVPIGIAVDEVEAMAIDPWRDARLEGKSGPNAPFVPAVDNGFVTDGLEFPRARITGLPTLAEVCEVSRRLGFAVGYSNSVGEDLGWSNTDGGDPGGTESDPTEPLEVVVSPSVSANVHVFQTEAGARAYLDWVPTTGWTGEPETKLLPEAGSDALLLRGLSDAAQVEVALVRRGSVVGEVTVIGTAGRALDAEAASMAVTFGRRIDSVGASGLPFDVMQALSVPLTQTEWSRALANEFLSGSLAVWIEGRSAYSSQSYDPLGEVCGDNYDYDFWTGREAVEAGLLYSTTSSGVLYADAASMDNMECELQPVVATVFTAFADSARAKAAMRKYVTYGLALPGGRLFDVPGIDGAVGVRHLYDPEGAPASLTVAGYSLNVYFTRGPSLARVVLVKPSLMFDDGVTQATISEEDLAADQDAISSASRMWAARLDRILSQTR